VASIADRRRFLRHLAGVRKQRWVVYAKPPFSGPEAVLAYLSRYTHRVALSNRRLMAFDETGVTFRYKDYRRDGPERQRVMTLAPHEFIRPLPAPCPATWLPPHPALRPARQFRPQGHYSARPRTACRGTAAGARRSARTTRLAPTLSLLRRADDHHRDLRAMAATTRATSRDRTTREQSVVTRHGLHSPHAATPPSRGTPPGAPFAKISATGLNVSRGQFPIHGPPGGKFHSRSPRQRERRAGFTIASTEQNPKSP
jgi:hypothetical protein